MSVNPYQASAATSDVTPLERLPPNDSQRPTRVRWQIVLLLMCFTGLNHFHRQSLPAVVTQVMEDCHFDERDMGWIYSSFLLGYVLFMIPGGWFSDRRGGWFALTLSGFGTAVLVAATGLCGLETAGIAFVAFVLVRCPMGVFTAPLFPAAGRIVADWVPFNIRALVNGLVLGATTVGVAAAPIVFGALSDWFGWRLAFVVTGTFTALVTCLWVWRGRNTPAEHPAVNAAELKLIGTSHVVSPQRPDAASFWSLLRNRSLMLLTLNYAAVGYSEYTLYYWMKYYFLEVLKYDEQSSRNFTTIVSSAMILAMPLGGILSDRLVRSWGYRAGRAAVPIFGMLSSAALLFAATRFEGQFAVVTLFFLAHAAVGLCEAPTWVAGLEAGGANCGTSSAIVNTGGNFGGLCAPVVTVYVAGAFGWNAGFITVSVVCLLGVAMWLGIRIDHPSKHQAV